MRFSKLAIGLGLALATITAANAAKFTLDYRHEYRSDYGQNFDRICFIAGFDNGIGFYVDSSFKSGSETVSTTNADGTGSEKGPEYHKGQWGDFVTNATEMGLSYNYKIGDTGFSIQPGLVTESTSSTTGYKPYLRVQYNTDFGLWFALRGRYDYWRNDNAAADNKNARLDAWIGYNYGNFGVNYNYTHMWAVSDLADGSPRYMYDKKKNNYEQNLRLQYRVDQWTPYIEFGDMAKNNSATFDGRQLRVRVGVAYSF